MPRRKLRLAAADATALRNELDEIRQELKVPAAFSAAAQADAERAIADHSPPELDLTDIPFVTIDPPASMDLDQALHLSRDGDRMLVRYAIADVPSFIEPESALDGEVHQRGVTYYGPDSRAPLHPVALSEGAASLLPGEDRPALVWEIRLDSSGEQRGDAIVRRAMVRSRAKLDYTTVQQDLNAGTAGEMLALLPIVGELRLEQERTRGGVSLPLPEQEIVATDHGFGLNYRNQLPVERWNAQLSLLTGIAAAKIMRDAGVGVFRSVPDADDTSLKRMRRTAKALQVDWPAELPYAELIPQLDTADPMHQAFLNQAAGLFRGSGYVAFDGAPPDEARHAAIAAEYAHVTAPLRRLVDRYGLAVCVAACADTEVPDWVLEGLPGLPDTMAETGRRANSYEAHCVAAVEAAVLTGREGETFPGVVVEVSVDNAHGEVVISDPAVRGRVNGHNLPLGENVTVSLVEASIEARRIAFKLA